MLWARCFVVFSNGQVRISQSTVLSRGWRKVKVHVVVMAEVDVVCVSLTATVLRVEVFVDGVERILLFAAMFSGSQDVPYTLVQEGILALKHTDIVRILLQLHHKNNNILMCISGRDLRYYH